MTRRQLTDTEKLEIAVNLLHERDMDEYERQCRAAESTPPLWEAGICPACGGEYYGEEMQVEAVAGEDTSKTCTYVCPDCGSTVEEYFELTNITARP